MRYWAFWIQEEFDDPVLGGGWVRARTMQEVRELIRHPEMNFTELPDDSGFPPEAVGPIYWREPLMS